MFARARCRHGGFGEHNPSPCEAGDAHRRPFLQHFDGAQKRRPSGHDIIHEHNMLAVESTGILEFEDVTGVLEAFIKREVSLRLTFGHTPKAAR